MGVDTNLFDVLNVSPSAEKADVDGAYALLKKIDPTNESFRLAWKILRDDNYRALYKKTSSLDDMYKSGFFDDKQDDDALWVNEDPRFICTPYHKIVERLPALSDSRSGVVLITTGSFSPLHNGHIEMLTLAKNSIEQQGECVLGGYIVPSHDSYVATKNNGEAGMSALLRVSLANLSVSESSWLMVDGSEALCNPCDRNFTDILRRIKKYLRFHFKNNNFKYYFVCGEDVYSFSDAFLESRECICVARELSTKATISESIIKDPAATLFLENHSETKKHSSTLVRKGNYDFLSPKASTLYQDWLSRFNRIQEYDSNNNFYYHIRVEGRNYYEAWLKQIDPVLLDKALNFFRKRIIKILQNAFLDSIPPSRDCHVSVSPIYLESQLKKLSEKNLDAKTISMDQCVDGDYTIGISRLFPVSDGQITAIQLVERPGMEDLRDQIGSIPDGEYYLVEDDIGSGQTMRLLKGLLPSSLKIKDIILMNRFNGDKKPKEELDIVDMRDFILGSREGGLVTLLSDASRVRSIYAYPYVNLTERAKVPFINSFSLSYAIWELNNTFFGMLGDSLVLGDLYNNAAAPFLLSGFSTDTKITDVCRWHMSILEQVIENQKLDYGIELYHIYDDEGLIEEGKKSISIAKERILEIVASKKSYGVTLLIDDYRSKNYLLPKEDRDERHNEIMSQFHLLLKEQGVHIDFFAFESMMIRIAKKIVKKIPKNILVKDYYKKKKSYVTMMKNQGFKIGLVEIWEDDIKYSCALLSAAWVLCRLGEEKIPSDRLVSVRGKSFSAKKIITVLPKEYESSENKSKIILLSAGYEHVLNKIESVYY